MANPPLRSLTLGLAFLLALVLLSGCGSPSSRADAKASGHGFLKEDVWGRRFHHRVYFNQQAQQGAQGAVLAIYLEGDGSPWLAPDQVAADPTPRNPLMLDLMARNTGPAVYLGRPCYFGVEDPACNPLLWTHERYSNEVVDSLAEVIRHLLARTGARRLSLFGHSGGATLAWLLAPRIPQTCALVTFAGNLDVGAWARFHGYSPLEGSLDPATQPGQAAAVPKLHFVGGRDTVIPAGVLRAAAEKQADSTLGWYEEYDHSCCWAEVMDRALAFVEAHCSGG